jgi:hypothetical protein
MFAEDLDGGGLSAQAQQETVVGRSQVWGGEEQVSPYAGGAAELTHEVENVFDMLHHLVGNNQVEGPVR